MTPDQEARLRELYPSASWDELVAAFPEWARGTIYVYGNKLGLRRGNRANPCPASAKLPYPRNSPELRALRAEMNEIWCRSEPFDAERLGRVHASVNKILDEMRAAGHSMLKGSVSNWSDAKRAAWQRQHRLQKRQEKEVRRGQGETRRVADGASVDDRQHELGDGAAVGGRRVARGVGG